MASSIIKATSGQLASSASSAKPARPSRANSSSLGDRVSNSMDSRSKRLEASMQRRAASGPLNLPTSTEQLFDPFMRSTKSLPEWAQNYMNLLTESSCTQGSVQTHLMKLLAKGAADMNKAAQFVADPMDGVTDVLADQGSHLILSSLDRCEWRIGGLVSIPSVGNPEPVPEAAEPEPEELPEPSTSGAADPASELEKDGSNKSMAAWGRLRMAVKSTALLKSSIIGRAKDDSCAPEPGPINPMHQKALSLMLSMMMSGATSGISHAMPAPPDLGNFMTQHSVEVTQSAAPEVKALKVAASFARAPSLAFRNSDCSDSIIGVSGMAASTAMKLLRSDSKGSSSSVAQVFGAILETVSESDNHRNRSKC